MQVMSETVRVLITVKASPQPSAKYAHNKRPATLEKALIASSQRHRTCLLRHLSTVRIQILPYQPGLAVPRSRVLDRRRPVPDLVVVDA